MCADEPTRQDDEDDIPGFIARMRAGEEAAARELLTRYEAGVRLVVRRQLPRILRTRFDSIDFLQSIWGSFFQRVRSGPTDIQDARQLSAFLAWAARNKVIDEYRRSASQRKGLHREEPLCLDGEHLRDLPAATETPSAVVQAREAFGRLRDLLPEDRRGILELKAEGFSSKEIGARLGISERTVQRVLEDLHRRAHRES